MLRLFITCVLAASVLLGMPGRAHAAAANLKLGTLAPRESVWGKVFSAWAKAVDEESKGALTMTWYWNGTQGDETEMIGKLRSKQIDGGAFTASGLSQINPNIIALQMPGLFAGWTKLDSARDKLRTKLDAGFDAAGFRILGTGDVGVAHYMSRGRPVRSPDDLKSMHTFFISGDVVNQKILETVGVSAPRELGVPEILPALSARTMGAVDVLNASPLAAEQLQWAPQVDHVTTMPTTFDIGALVIDKRSYAALPADARAILDRTAANTGKVLTERIRALDQAAYERIKKTKQVVDPTPTEVAAWNAVFAKVRTSLRTEGKVNPELFDEVVNAAR